MCPASWTAIMPSQDSGRSELIRTTWWNRLTGRGAFPGAGPGPPPGAAVAGRSPGASFFLVLDRRLLISPDELPDTLHVFRIEVREENFLAILLQDELEPLLPLGEVS